MSSLSVLATAVAVPAASAQLLPGEATGAPAAPPLTSASTSAPPSPADRPDRPDRDRSRVDADALADGELPSLRTEHSRTYRLDNGTLKAQIAARPVNHQDEQGVWQKNDTALVDDGAGGGRNKAGGYRLTLPRELAARPVTTAAGPHSVGFALEGGRGTLKRSGDTGTYAEALPGVDLSYQAQDAGVKEVLVLKTAAAPTSYAFTTSLSRGLRLTEAADGGLVATDDAGAEQLRFSPPNVQDSSDKPAGFSTTATDLALTGPADAPTVTLSLDKAWLADPARVFPVHLDPSYDRVAASRTYLNSAAATTNHSGATAMRVGTDTGGARNHALMTFNTATVPRDVEVYDAILSADVAGADPNAGGVSVAAKPLTRAFTASTATWNTYDGTNAWTTAGGDAGATAASTVFDAGDYSLNFDLTDLARNWVNGATANHGLQLSTTSTSTGTSIALGKGSFNPVLTIWYLERTGDQPYYTYSSAPLTDRAEVKVNVATGNLLLANDDLRISAPGLDQTASRFYNSRSKTPATAFGRGWALAPGRDDRIEYLGVEPDSGLVQYGPTGTAVLWRARADGTYPSAPGSGGDLVTSADGSQETMTDRRTGTKKVYSSEGRLQSVTDRNGNRITYAYDPNFLDDVISITDTAGRMTSLAYGGCGLSSMTDSAGRTWQYGYDSSCRLTSYTDPAGKVTGYGYTTGGLLNRVTTPAGRTTLMTYDSAGRALTVTRVTDAASNTGPTTTYAYTGTGGGNGRTTVTDPNGKTATYEHDAQSRVTKVTDPLNRSRTGAYNADNAVTSAVDALSASSSFGFDSDFRSTVDTAPTGGKTTLRYAETAGTVTSRAAHWQPSGSIDANGSDTSYTYDGPGNLTASSTAAPTGAVSASYTYNPPAPAAAVCGGKPGQTCTATDGNNNTTRYSYSSAGDLTAVDNPAPLGDTSSSYDSLGRETSQTDGKGQVTRYTYDNLDRITQVRLSGATACTGTELAAGTCVAYGYDDDGNRTSQADQTGTTSYGYDALGRQTSKTLPGQAPQTLAYDPAGNLTSATDPGGTTAYRYDAANQLTHLAEPGGSCTATPTSRCTTFGYDNNGTRTGTTYPTGTPTVMTMTPDASGRVQRIRAVTGSTVHSDVAYTYAGGTGGDTALTRSRTDAVAGRTTAYGYDTLNRLTSAVEKDGAGATAASWSYGYDKAGNRTSATIGTTANTFGYNAANQLTSRNGSTAGFAYDANGNETAAVGATTRTGGSWNNKDQLTAVTAGGTSVPFAYTGLSQNERISRAGTTFAASPVGLATETTGGAVTSFVRDPGGTLIALRAGGQSYYYLFDGLGSVVGLVNSSGSKVNSYSYDPYGISRVKTEAVANPFEYTGGYLDDATGLYKLGIRYYDPTLGRFTQTDPTGQDPHYTYAGNDPVNYTDLSGAGAKSYLVKLALQFVASAIRNGSDEFIRLGGRFLDAPAKRVLRERSGSIANTIDRVANIPGVTTNIARQKVYSELVRQGVSTGTAQVIATAVEGVLFIIL